MAAEQASAAPSVPWNPLVHYRVGPHVAGPVPMPRERFSGWGATTNFWQPPILSAPILKVPGLDDVKPVVLKELAIVAKISGFLSRTTVFMTFFNPHDRVLEGELEFPLPEGATVSGYGLDVHEDGVHAIVDATIVEKKKAREIFEAEVRKGVDPGLVEFKKGNVFNTRVYPLPAQGSRTIKVEYASELFSDSDGRMYYFHPISVKNELDFSLTVEVLVAGTEEAPVFATEELSGIALNKTEIAAGTYEYSINVQERNWQFQSDSAAVLINVPRPADKTPVVYVESSNQPDEMEQFYFVVQDYVPPMKNLKTGAGLAKRIAVFWDASLSRATTPKEREIQLVQRIVKEKVDPAGHVDLYVFRNVLESRVEFAAAKVGDLIEHLNKMPYDGATRLDDLQLEDCAASAQVGFVLLFTDGLASVGGDSAPLVENPRAPVYAISGTGKNTNSTLLKHFSNSTGGQYFDVNRFKDDNIVASVGIPTFALVSASGADLVHIVPAIVTPVAVTSENGQYVTIVGRLTRPGQSELVVEYGYSKNEILHTSKHVVSSAVATDTGLVPLLWAQQALNAMSALADKFAEEIKELGQRFKIVTPGTSLLVLESLDQHIEHNIEPHPNRKNLWERYHAIMEGKKRETVRSEESKLSRVTGMWATRVSWWQKDFSYDWEAQLEAREAEEYRRAEEEDRRKNDPVYRRMLQENDEKKERKTPSKSKKMSSDDLDGAPMLEQLCLAAAPAPVMARSMAAPRRMMAEESIMSRDIAMPIEERRRERVVEAAECEEEADDGDVMCASAEPEMLMDADEAAPSASDAPSGSSSVKGVGVTVQAWDPSTPYIEAFKQVQAKDIMVLYKAYLEQRDKPEMNWVNSPAFYFDCAHFFLNQSSLDAKMSRVLGVRILTNIPELKLEEPQLLRMLGYKLDEMNELSLACEIFEKVLKLRPDEPQSHRDLALVEEKRGREHYQRAVDLLWAVVVGPNWRSDFDEVEITALVEMNAIIAKAEREKVKLNLPERSGPFIKNLECDLRISMGWDTDMTDFDLHVVEPNSEECYFGHRDTQAGGMMSRDFRQGYGPEEYMLKKAYCGEFRAWTNYFAMHSATLTGPSSIILKIFVNWGRADQKEYVTLTRLQESKNNATLGTISFPRKKPPVVYVPKKWGEPEVKVHPQPADKPEPSDKPEPKPTPKEEPETPETPAEPAPVSPRGKSKDKCCVM